MITSSQISTISKNLRSFPPPVAAGGGPSPARAPRGTGVRKSAVTKGGRSAGACRGSATKSPPAGAWRQDRGTFVLVLGHGKARLSQVLKYWCMKPPMMLVAFGAHSVPAAKASFFKMAAPWKEGGARRKSGCRTGSPGRCGRLQGALRLGVRCSGFGARTSSGGGAIGGLPPTGRCPSSNAAFRPAT